ncbi:hypothetical protein ACIQGZ_17090 [Streptomyces sp. NPDC092296]|uniref:hypothetical protein n=1 Tax=Streptomyces sp. NPDC092296 TaxID=3366012 RepID=UPI00382BA9D1
MSNASGSLPTSGSTPPTPAPLPTREPGATYPGSSTYRQPAATVGKPKPAPSRPVAPYGAPSLGLPDAIAWQWGDFAADRAFGDAT